MSKSNVWTIGAAFYYALTQIQSEYLLFLENDFKMDVLSSPQNTMVSQLRPLIADLRRCVVMCNRLGGLCSCCATCRWSWSAARPSWTAASKSSD